MSTRVQKKKFLKRWIALGLVFLVPSIVFPPSGLAKSAGSSPPPTAKSAVAQKTTIITPTLHVYKIGAQLPIQASWVMKFDKYQKSEQTLRKLNYVELNPKIKTQTIGGKRITKVESIIARHPNLVHIILFPFVDENDDNLELITKFFSNKDVKARLTRLQKGGVQISVYHYPSQKMDNWTPAFSTVPLVKEIKNTADVDELSFQQSIYKLLQKTNSSSIGKNKEFLNKPVVFALWADSSDNPIKSESSPKANQGRNENTAVMVLNIEKKDGLFGGSGLLEDMTEFCDQNKFHYDQVDISPRASKDASERSYRVFNKAVGNMSKVPPLHSMITLESNYDGVAPSRIFELSWWGGKKTLHAPLTPSLYSQVTQEIFEEFEITLKKRKYSKLDRLYVKLAITDHGPKAIKKYHNAMAGEIAFALKKEKFQQAVKFYQTVRKSMMPSASFSKKMKKNIEKKMSQSFHAKLAKNALNPAEKQLASFKALLPDEKAFLAALRKDLSKAKQKKDANTLTSELLELETAEDYSAAEETISKLNSNPYANTKQIGAIDTRIKNQKQYNKGIAALNKGDLAVGVTTIVQWQKKGGKSETADQTKARDAAYTLIFQKILEQDQNVDKMMGEHILRVAVGNPDLLVPYYSFIAQWLSGAGTNQGQLVEKIALLPRFSDARKSLESVKAVGDIVRLLDLTTGKTQKTLDDIEKQYISVEDGEGLSQAFDSYIGIARAQSLLAVTRVLNMFAQSSPDISGEKLIAALDAITEDPVLEGWSEHVSWSVIPQKDFSSLPAKLVSLASRDNVRMLLEDRAPNYAYYILLDNDEIIEFTSSGTPTLEEGNQFNLLTTDESKERAAHLKVFSGLEYQTSTLASIALVAKLTSSYEGSKPEELIKNATSKSIPQNLLAYLMVLGVGEEGKVERLYVQPSSIAEETISDSQYNQAELSFVISGSDVIEMGVPYFKVNPKQENLFDTEKIGVIRAGFKNFME